MESQKPYKYGLRDSESLLSAKGENASAIAETKNTSEKGTKKSGVTIELA